MLRRAWRAWLGGLGEPGDRDLLGFVARDTSNVRSWTSSGGTIAFSVREVRAQLARTVAYTTVMTTLDRLFKKGLLERVREGRAFVYRAAHTRQDVEAAVASGCCEGCSSAGPAARDRCFRIWWTSSATATARCWTSSRSWCGKSVDRAVKGEPGVRLPPSIPARPSRSVSTPGDPHNTTASPCELVGREDHPPRVGIRPEEEAPLPAGIQREVDVDGQPSRRLTGADDDAMLGERVVQAFVAHAETERDDRSLVAWRNDGDVRPQHRPRAETRPSR